VRRWRTTIVLIGILLLAAALRLGHLELTEFKFDEALVCNCAAEFVDSGRLPATGIGSSVGIANPPLAVILMALPVAVARDPILASGFVALLNVGAVLGCFWLGRRYLSARGRCFTRARCGPRTCCPRSRYFSSLPCSPPWSPNGPGRW